MRRGPFATAPILSACAPRAASLSSTPTRVASLPCTCRVQPVGIALTAVSSKPSHNRYFPLAHFEALPVCAPPSPVPTPASPLPAPPSRPAVPAVPVVPALLVVPAV